MIEKTRPKTSLSRTQLKEKCKDLCNDLSLLSHELKEKKLPVIIIIEGIGGSGKGEVIKKIISQLDPRFFNVKANAYSTFEKRNKPFLWRYWRDIPPAG